MNSVFLTSDIRVIGVHSPLTITKTISENQKKQVITLGILKFLDVV